VKKNGFTLIETVMAMVILSTGILLLANSWSGSFMRVRETQLSTEVAALLERKMIEVETKYNGKPLESIPEEEADDFGSDYPQYSWKMTSKPLEVPNITATMTAQAGGADEMSLTIMRTLVEHLGNSIKEVKVSVIYTGGKKPLEFSATQYFVNYDKQLPMPAMPGGIGQ
jgi:general secretion pathway protein I